MTKRYQRTDLYNVWVNHSFDIPDDYVIPLNDDGWVDYEKFDEDLWDNPTLRKLDEDTMDAFSTALRAVPGYAEDEFSDSGIDREIIDTENDRWPWGVSPEG